MSQWTITLSSFALFLVSAFVGMWIGKVCPPDQWERVNQDLVKETRRIMVALATMTLSLILAWSNTSYDARQKEIEDSASKIVALDSTLAKIGDKSQLCRQKLRDIVHKGISRIETIKDYGFNTEKTRNGIGVNKLEIMILEIKADNEREDWLKNNSLSMVRDISQYKWLRFSGADGSIQAPFLLIMNLWLAIIFLSYGLVAPINRFAMSIIVVVAAATASAILMILDLDSPSGGIINSISSEPLKSALLQIAG